MDLNTPAGNSALLFQLIQQIGRRGKTETVENFEKLLNSVLSELKQAKCDKTPRKDISKELWWKKYFAFV